MDLQKQLVKEINAINRTLAGFGVNAGCCLQKTFVGGDQIVIYRIGKAPSVRIRDIENVMREITEAVSSCRRQTAMIRLLQNPLRFETTHPYRKPLLWNSEAAKGQPHALLLGRTYNGGASDLWLSFDNAPHMLVAGTTGAGKSIELANMLLGLCWNTSPVDLRIALIDLKATDLVPFRRLPHVDTLATDIEPATEALCQAEALRKNREGTQAPTPRLLVVIDEYADIATDKNAMAYADRIARKGRSANVNLLVATQHPTGATMGSSTIKANFNNRLVGMVTDANAAHNAAGRPGTHAELLPGKGAFLWINGPEAVRFQSYLLTEIDIESLITRICRKWESSTTTTAIYDVPTRVGRSGRTSVEPVVVEPVERYQPHDEIAAMAETMRPHWQPGISKNAISLAAFGKAFAGTTWTAKVNAALERLTSTASAHASATVKNISRTDDKIIKLKRTGS